MASNADRTGQAVQGQGHVMVRFNIKTKTIETSPLYQLYSDDPINLLSMGQMTGPN